jgi:KamA family protein
MAARVRIKPRAYRAYGPRDIEHIPELDHLGPHDKLTMQAVSKVLPFKVNNYVIEELIRWHEIPDDPIYQLTFPQAEMLERKDLERMMRLVQLGANRATIQTEARKIQEKLNPHPAGQMELNVPHLGDKPLPGMQHKYRETVLFFPSQGQTCHAYCTYCFRWAQFVGIDKLKFAAREADMLADYLRRHTEVSSVLLTGGDPMIMKSAILRRYIEPLLGPEFEHLTSIRIGTKALAYWPYRFLTDADADDVLRLFDRVRRSGRHLALMAHYSHPRELDTAEAQAALRRVHRTGAVIRTQAPLIRHVNDSSHVWADMWRHQVQLGAVPYYMFVERDTGPKDYFEVPLARGVQIFRRAYRKVSGLARTARGPSMSATPGKVLVDGMATINGEKVFVLRFIQARDPAWVDRPFFARYDPDATWLRDLRPAFGKEEFFFDQALTEIKQSRCAPAWGERPPKRRRLAVFGQVEWE